jgi:hypothetical protein
MTTDQSYEIEIKSMINDLINKYLAFINSETLRDKIYEITQREYLKGLETGEIKFNMNFAPDYQTLSFVQNYSFNNINGMIESLKDDLRKQMSIGLMNREPISKLKERIRDTFDLTISRAENITRTESVRAFNMGHYQAAKESGLDIRKQWSAQPEKDEDNPCPICLSLDMQIVDMNDKFKDKNNSYWFLPPTHPRCKCRVLYIQKPKVKTFKKKGYIIQNINKDTMRIVEDAA